jgi:acetolactate synthase small subunit
MCKKHSLYIHTVYCHYTNHFFMQNLFLILLFAIAQITLCAQAAPQPINTTIREVTVFKNGAQFMRSGTQTLPAGRSEWVFKGLSPHINAKTIQLKTADGVTILSVRFQINYLEGNKPQAEIARLEAESQTLNDKMALLHNDLNVLKQEENLLSKNQVQLVGVSNTVLKTEDLKAMADFQRGRWTDILNKQFEINQQLAALTKALEAVQKQLAPLQKTTTTPSGEVIAVVNAEKAGNSPFTLRYYTNQAGWEPVYDVRVKDVASPISLYQKAHVFQQTGEDWREVRLSLSTGNPSEQAVQPTLNTWRLLYSGPYVRGQTLSLGGRYVVTGNTAGYREVSGVVLDGETGEALIGATVAITGTTTGAATDYNGKFTLKLPADAAQLQISYTGYTAMLVPVSSGQNLQIALMGGGTTLQETVVTGYAAGAQNDRAKAPKPEEYAAPTTVVQLPTTLLYEVDQPVTMPSDGKQQTVDIEHYSLPAHYRYYCAPKLDLNAYLAARVTDWETLGLLSGEANVFFEGTYLGKSYLEFASTDDTLNISLGRDKNMVITRTKIKDYSKRQFLSDNKKDSRSFEIAVNNKKQQMVELVLEDQIPVSGTKDISVDLLEKSGATFDEETGKLRWQLQLGASASQKMRFAYSVKYPKERVVVLE